MDDARQTEKLGKLANRRSFVRTVVVVVARSKAKDALLGCSPPRALACSATTIICQSRFKILDCIFKCTLIKLYYRVTDVKHWHGFSSWPNWGFLLFKLLLTTWTLKNWYVRGVLNKIDQSGSIYTVLNLQMPVLVGFMASFCAFTPATWWSYKTTTSNTFRAFRS